MESSHNNPPKSKPNLTLLAGEKPLLIAGGHNPDESMQPGKYIAKIQAVNVRKDKQGASSVKLTAILLFEITEGPHSGTALRQWLSVNEIKGIVGAGTKYYQHCALAFHRPIKRGDNLDPEVIFTDKLCVVSVGYSLKDSKRQSNPANALIKKYERDFLRVHEILEVL